MSFFPDNILRRGHGSIPPKRFVATLGRRDFDNCNSANATSIGQPTGACLQGAPKKATHFRAIVKIVLKTRQQGWIFSSKRECKRSIGMLSVGIKYSMCDVLCDVIIYCV